MIDAGLQAEVLMFGTIPPTEVHSLIGQLSPGQMVSGGGHVRGRCHALRPGHRSGGSRSRHGAIPRRGIGYSTRGSGYYPVKGLAQPVKLVQQLGSITRNRDGDWSVMLPGLDTDEPLYLLRLAAHETIGNVMDRGRVLRKLAVQQAGEAQADALTAVWKHIDRGVGLLPSLRAGGQILSLGCVNQRWLTRPLVPFPLELEPEERDYFRRFQFQANSEAGAADLANLQGTRWVGGNSGMWITSNVFHDALGELQAARAAARECSWRRWPTETAGRQRAPWPVPRGTRLLPARGTASSAAAGITPSVPLALRLQRLERALGALLCVIRNAMHAIHFQCILDATDPTDAPANEPVLVEGDERFRKMQTVARLELDNCYELIALIQAADVPLIDTASTPEGEDVLAQGPELVAQLRKKAAIMLDHWMDFNRLYTRPNR